MDIIKNIFHNLHSLGAMCFVYRKMKKLKILDFEHSKNRGRGIPVSLIQTFTIFRWHHRHLTVRLRIRQILQNCWNRR